MLTFEWNSAKASSNVRKHDVTFEDAASVFLDPSAMTYADPDHSGAEVREITIGHTGNGRLLFVYHTERAGRIRVIGARSATRSERRQHEEGH